MAIDLSNVVLIEDTREQSGYGPLFTQPYIRQGLAVGDYSVCGLEDRIALERKSLADLVGSFTSGRTRFEAEFRKARSFEYFAVVVEAPLSHVLEGRFDHSQAKPQAIFESMTSWSVKYRTPFFFCETREIAARTVQSLLMKYARQFFQTAETVASAAKRLRSA
jgi:DNA excision repair protein ERCC-4